jgi:hypothetical protein
MVIRRAMLSRIPLRIPTGNRRRRRRSGVFELHLLAVPLQQLRELDAHALALLMYPLHDSALLLGYLGLLALELESVSLL